ncbi:hypothetical protein HK098_003557 [Nowakowskiella sp. JEL0407]|nr:hypothetical protein HK098_003557 [Nowakowskiella sp. JEL0407]
MPELFREPLIVQAFVLFVIKNGDVINVEKHVELPNEMKDSFRTPSFSKDESIMDFIMDIDNEIGEIVGVLKEKFDRRYQLIMTFVDAFLDNLLEYDSQNYTYASFLFEVPAPAAMSQGSQTQDPTAVMNVHLNGMFPEVAPAVVLASPLTFNSGNSHVPDTMILDVPYNSNIPIEQYVTNIRMSLFEKVPMLFESSKGVRY